MAANPPAGSELSALVADDRLEVLEPLAVGQSVDRGVPVTVIVVSYNTCESLRRCLASLEGQAAEVIVVDNASRDGSPAMVLEEFPWVRLARSSVNRGFGRANNIGLTLASYEACLLLNSDCVAESGAIDKLFQAYTGCSPDPVAAGGGLYHRAPASRENLQESAAGRLTLWAVLCEQLYLEKLFPGSRVLSPYWRSHRAFDQEIAQVEQVMGACLMLNRRHRFDERFFLYCEDTELCHRLRQEGPIIYVPGAAFYHELGASTSTRRWWAVAMYNRGKELFFSVHQGALAMMACWLLNRLGALIRLVVWLLVWLLTLGRRGSPGLWVRVLFAPPVGPALPGDAR